MRVLRSPELRMNLKRTATIAVVGAALAAWLARRGDVESCRAAAPSSSDAADAIDTRGAALASEIARLHERLAPDGRAAQPGRNLFAFHARRAAPAPAPIAPAPRPALTRARGRAAVAAAAEARRHRRRRRRRRPGPHRHHLRRGSAVPGEGRRDRHVALPRREDLGRRRRADRRHRSTASTARVAIARLQVERRSLNSSSTSSL